MIDLNRNMDPAEMETVKAAIRAASARHPKEPGRVFKYGTAGFRMNADLLDPVMFRVGLVADLLSRANGGNAVGVMITASHNAPCDNGVKLIDSTGGMIEGIWEQCATELVNQETDADVADKFFALAEDLKIKMSLRSQVRSAHDSRSSCAALTASLKDAVETVNGLFYDYGLFTTPQLHYVIRCLISPLPTSDGYYGAPTEEGYYDKMAKAFIRAAKQSAVGRPFQLPKKKVIVDCACGVGGPKLEELASRLTEYLNIEIRNSSVENPDQNLNIQCGADFVKTKIKWPRNMTPEQDPDVRYASLDGDADRVVYYYNNNGSVGLLDGDRIAALFASHFSHLLHVAGADLKVGVVQTGYANGASTEYLRQSLRLDVTIANTGVKNLHRDAKNFDIGIYFEANGHGTILFNEARFAEAEAKCTTEVQKIAMNKLAALKELTNQTVGDAISDLLLVEATLLQLDWDSPSLWASLYTDRANILDAIKVPDRELFVTTEQEIRLAKPDRMQAAIDDLVAQYGGRAFIRPSGTENVVRLYVEADDPSVCDLLYSRLKALIVSYQ